MVTARFVHVACLLLLLIWCSYIPVDAGATGCQPMIFNRALINARSQIRIGLAEISVFTVFSNIKEDRSKRARSIYIVCRLLLLFWLFSSILAPVCIIDFSLWHSLNFIEWPRWIAGTFHGLFQLMAHRISHIRRVSFLLFNWREWRKNK